MKTENVLLSLYLYLVIKLPSTLPNCERFPENINLSIKTSISPDKLKEAKITPIYKKGDKSEPCNYRPISILPTLSKIFEKHMASQIKSYVSEFNLLQKEQSGFREHHSCMTALTKMTEAWLSEMDSGNLTGTVLLDFSKAFDLVSHNI